MTHVVATARHVMRSHKVLTVLFVVVVYTFLIPFYYDRLTRRPDELPPSLLLKYEFVQAGIMFEGPAFTSVTKGDTSMTLSDRLGSVDVVVRSAGDMQVKKGCETENRGVRDRTFSCRAIVGQKVVEFSTREPGLFVTVERMAGSVKVILE